MKNPMIILAIYIMGSQYIIALGIWLYVGVIPLQEIGANMLCLGPIRLGVRKK